MFRRHVTPHLVAYCQGELSASLAERITQHLERCPRCHAECEEIRLGLQFVGSLPRAAAPAALWHRIETALDASARVSPRSNPSPDAAEEMVSLAGGVGEVDGRRDGTPHHRTRRRLRFNLAVAAVLVGLVAIGLTWQRRHAGTVAYQVEDVAEGTGNPRPTLRGAGRLRVGQWLVTSASSRARLDLADMGQVEIQPNSRVGLLPSRARERRLSLAHGTLEAFILAPPRLFFVDTPSALAVDLGCRYTLHVDRATGRGLLRVSLGYVAFEWQGREAIVPMGAACETRPGIGPGTPYFENTSAALRAALSRFDFEQRGAPMLDRILAHARRGDAFTLWHLLRRVAPADRLRVYQRLVQLQPPPPDVTRDGILNLNPGMLDVWKDAIEDSWWE